MGKKYIFLVLAILLEVIATAFLTASFGFTKKIPSIITIIAYVLCFYCLSLSLKELPLSFVYAVWAGVGMILTALVSYFIFKQSLDLPAVIGITLITVGVFIMKFFSKTV